MISFELLKDYSVPVTALVAAIGSFYTGRAVTQYRIADLAKEVESLRAELETLNGDVKSANLMLASVSTDIKWLINGRDK